MLVIISTAPAYAQNYSILHSFKGPDGMHPAGSVIQDSAGNLYGTAEFGGLGGGRSGVVFKLDITGAETVLHNFTGPDGQYPTAGLVQDPAGNLYGTTIGGGKFGFGVVFKLDMAGNETVLYSFTGGADGSSPLAGLIRDSAGNLYGTTDYGGVTGGACPSVSGCGVLFKLDTANNETVLHAFQGSDGANPNAGVIRDTAGNFYGTTYYGGTANWGVVYKLDPGGHESVLYNFRHGKDGASPIAGVTLDAAGNLYGTTFLGGHDNMGVVYKLDPSGRQTVLHIFTGRPDGASSESGVILDSAGNLYGTTYSGGSVNGGTVYKIDTAGHESIVYNFSVANGTSPFAGLIQDAAGNFYGTTNLGSVTGNFCGSHGCGVVFRLTP